MTDAPCCSVSGCRKPEHARGFCNTHYKQQRKKGRLPAIFIRVRGESLREKFNRLYTKAPPGCWQWNRGPRAANGYGGMQFQGRYQLAHRWSWEIFHGSIPDGAEVCHHCDNPRCVNPEHLFLGSHSENMKDMVAKKRNDGPKGESHHRAKLTRKQVDNILARPNETPAELASEFGVSVESIRLIRRRKTWK